VLLGVSGYLSSKKWEKAAHERKVARRRAEHWSEMEVGMKNQDV
jgi:hypothetical protein